MNSNVQYKFGYTPDLDSPKDYQFEDLKAKLGAIPSSGDVDLTPYCTPSNQLNLSSCVGNATADSVEVLNSIAGYKPVQLSRMFIYSLARIKDGDLNLVDDEGTYIRTAFSVLEKFGVCDEYLWPYKESAVHIKPPIKAMRQAAGHKIEAYYRISTTGSKRIEDMVAALHSGHPIVFGTQASASFMDVKDRTPIKIPTASDRLLGGHAMLVVGYVAGSFIVKNSWGTGWGSRGFCCFDASYFEWDEIQDLWVPTLGTAFS